MARRAQARNNRAAERRVREAAFGDFQRQLMWSDAVLRQGLAEHIDKVRIMQIEG